MEPDIPKDRGRFWAWGAMGLASVLLAWVWAVPLLPWGHGRTARSDLIACSRESRTDDMLPTHVLPTP